tara:strand:- start:29303 stop:29815 length:513 start_codon:yes stop_codon:yes gene_type:complete
MEQNAENKADFKNRSINFYILHKIKILTLAIILIIFFTFMIFLNYKNEKDNELVAENYIKAGIYLASNKKKDAIKIYDNIILGKNDFYSILSLNTIIEKNLISDQKTIIKYFEILEEKISNREQENLILLKKALYLIKIENVQNGNKLLKSLAERDTILKTVVQDLLKNR